MAKIHNVGLDIEQIITICNCYKDVSNSSDTPNAKPVERKENKQLLLVRLIENTAIEAQGKLR